MLILVLGIRLVQFYNLSPVTINESQLMNTNLLYQKNLKEFHVTQGCLSILNNSVIIIVFEIWLYFDINSVVNGYFSNIDKENPAAAFCR